ncbi:A24 family peptidase [Kiloniella antarctica]|uniref:Prepilin peptidase n=1 Tax=Kiloniella antarctica TaxID=1550907 RepID=A0ABW5BNA0_9PROT
MELEPFFITKFVLVAFVIIAMLSDLIQMRIPNVIPVAIILLFPVAYLGGGAATPLLDHIGAMLVVLVAGVALFAFKILGGGDVKFLSSLALWTGFGLLPPFVVILSLVGGGQVIIILLLRKFSHQLEYLLAKFNIQLPEWLQRDGGVPYGLSIGIAMLIVFERLPYWS